MASTQYKPIAALLTPAQLAACDQAAKLLFMSRAALIRQFVDEGLRARSGNLDDFIYPAPPPDAPKEDSNV